MDNQHQLFESISTQVITPGWCALGLLDFIWRITFYVYSVVKIFISSRKINVLIESISVTQKTTNQTSMWCVWSKPIWELFTSCGPSLPFSRSEIVKNYLRVYKTPSVLISRIPFGLTGWHWHIRPITVVLH